MFRYTTGNAASVPAWFTAFEVFIQQCGWTIVAGAGTTNLTIRSLGVNRRYSKLFANVRRNLSRVICEVQDDAVGTHKTTSGYFCDGGAGAFDYVSILQ